MNIRTGNQSKTERNPYNKCVHVMKIDPSCTFWGTAIPNGIVCREPENEMWIRKSYLQLKC